MERHFYKSGQCPFSVSIDTDGEMVDACIFDPESGSMKRDMTAVMQRLFLASDEIEEIDEKAYLELIETAEANAS